MKIITNLRRGLFLYSFAIFLIFSLWLITANKGMLIILILSIYSYFDYIFSKQLFCIEENNQTIAFEVLYMSKRRIFCEKDEVKIVCIKEVFFRGGKIETYKLFHKNNNRKIAQVSEKQFSNKEDLKSFKDFFNLT